MRIARKIFRRGVRLQMRQLFERPAYRKPYIHVIVVSFNVSFGAFCVYAVYYVTRTVNDKLTILPSGREQLLNMSIEDQK